MSETRRWSRLDNAAKIFPPTSSKRDTKVFRFSCELFDAVDPGILQSALNKTIERFPFYQSVIKKGLFWYYLEESNLKPVVAEDARAPCAALYNGDKRSLLFQVTYYKKRINLEVFHALSDGTGAIHFIRTLVFYYLTEKHENELGKALLLNDYDAAEDQKKLDSFYKFYTKDKYSPKTKVAKAYRIKGERVSENGISVIGGLFSATDLLKIAKEKGSTLTEFVTAVLICAIHDTMSLRDEPDPVVITVPVNLRKYFPNESARNFFSTINIQYNFSSQPNDFEEILKSVREQFKKLLTKEQLQKRMNSLSSLEHSMLTKIVPLVIKDPALRYFNWLNKKESTAQFSNVGRIDLPGELSKYIRMVDVLSSTDRLQVCLCTFGDNMLVSITSAFVSTSIQRYFFRTLTGYGIRVEIISNTQSKEEA